MLDSGPNAVDGTLTRRSSTSLYQLPVATVRSLNPARSPMVVSCKPLLCSQGTDFPLCSLRLVSSVLGILRETSTDTIPFPAKCDPSSWKVPLKAGAITLRPSPVPILVESEPREPPGRACANFPSRRLGIGSVVYDWPTESAWGVRAAPWTGPAGRGVAIGWLR